MKIADLTPAERRLWRAFPTGATVDLRQAGDEPEHGGTWGPERTVRAHVLRALLLSGTPDDGEIAALRLSGARITGVLNLQYATIEHAIRLWACHFEQTPILYGAKVRQLNLSESYLPGLTAATLQVGGVLRITDCRIPGPVQLAGERLELLDRDDDGYVPHAYEQLAAAYRRVGDDAGARAVQLAKQRRHRRTLSWYAKIWGHVQDATVGYGFRPTRAMAWLVALLLVGTVLYGLHHPQPVEPGKAPDFHAAVYTLDLLLPIIDFGQEKAFNPHGGYQWLAYLLIAAGWILATTVIAGITRAVNRQ
jgi:hypothetical protein